jgi:hypothetical protein
MVRWYAAAAAAAAQHTAHQQQHSTAEPGVFADVMQLFS